MFGQLLPNKNKQVTVATVTCKFGRRQLGAQLNKALVACSGSTARLGASPTGLPCTAAAACRGGAAGRSKRQQ